MNAGDGAGVGGTADSSSASSGVSGLIFTVSQRYQYFVDQSTPLVLFLSVLTLIYALRVYLVKGFNITTNDKQLCSPLLPWQFQFLFPEELLYEVFLRLPVRSLLRFRSVSKGMRRLIDSSGFIRNHNIHRSFKLSERAAARSLLIDSPSSYSDSQECVVLLYHSRLNQFYSLNFEKFNYLNIGKAIEVKCCNLVKEGRFSKAFACFGIFGFLKLDPHRYILWNPSNDTSRNVDCSSFPPFENVSMCCDNANDDYKIVGFINRDASAMQVYSLRTDSWTKLFPTDFPSGWICDEPVGITKGVCVGGIMHWMWTTGNHGDVKSIFIIAFNLATEMFTSSLPLPSEARQLQLQPCHFSSFRHCLCVTFVPPGYLLTTDAPHTIWVMKKYGVESSWTRLYNFKIDTLHTIPNYYFPNNRGRLLCFYKQVSWWDPQEGTFEKIEIPELIDAYPIVYPLVYGRNLIRLDQESCLASLYGHNGI